jgi:hypothetical protein
MRTLYALLVCAGLAAAQQNVLTPKEKKQGWQLLFDGRTFRNWEDPSKKSPPGDSFVIEDGCLKATSHPRYNEDLFSSATYQDFELMVDWRVSPRGNSGIKYRIQDRIWVKEIKGKKFEDQVAMAYQNRSEARPEKGQQYVVGFEFQAIDNEGHADGRRGGSHASGAMYDFLAPIKQMAKPVGEWNQARIVVKGSHVEHWLNGEKVLDADLKSPEIAERASARWQKGSEVYKLLVNQPVKSGRISLQNHNDEAWFRNIKLRRLK